jgi:hypothetical protein
MSDDATTDLMAQLHLLPEDLFDGEIRPRTPENGLLDLGWGHLTKGKFMYAKTSSSLSTVAWLGAMETKRQSRTSPPPSPLLAIVS